MKHAEITPKTAPELDSLLADSRKQLAQLTLDMRTKQIKQVKQIAAVKRTIARTLTVQRERELKEEHNG